ncbi:unnamed protein product [Urochloa decumbens]|uniref:Uncharacterized protein n=1 Tax=Urochloa decumbens TaxID=240449 RepID=A0ABC9EDG9_9POAL
MICFPAKRIHYYFAVPGGSFSSAPQHHRPPTLLPLIPRRLPPSPSPPCTPPLRATAKSAVTLAQPRIASPRLPCAPPPPPPRVCSRCGGDGFRFRARRREDADRGRMRCCVCRVSSAGCRAMGVATSSLRSRRCLRMRPSYAPFSEPFTERPAPAAPSSPAAAPRA